MTFHVQREYALSQRHIQLEIIFLFCRRTAIIHGYPCDCGSCSLLLQTVVVVCCSSLLQQSVVVVFVVVRCISLLLQSVVIVCCSSLLLQSVVVVCCCRLLQQSVVCQTSLMVGLQLCTIITHYFKQLSSASQYVLRYRSRSEISKSQIRILLQIIHFEFVSEEFVEKIFDELLACQTTKKIVDFYNKMKPRVVLIHSEQKYTYNTNKTHSTGICKICGVL